MAEQQSGPVVAVVGSLNMDIVVSAERMPRIGETIAGESVHYIPGGKGANQAVACARLGAAVKMMGAVGDDLFGRTLIEQLENERIDVRAVERIADCETGIASIIHTRDDNCIVIVPGANGRYTPARFAAVENTLDEADLLLVQLEIPPDTVKAALSAARTRGIPTVLNPAPAPPEPFGDDGLALLDYITPNETEFEALTGGSADDDGALERSLREWESRHRCKMIVTRGKRGCSYLSGDRFVTVPPLAVEVVDTTGAGDAFTGAFAWAVASGWALDDAVRWAVCASSLSVTRFGAQGGLPGREDVERFRQ